METTKELEMDTSASNDSSKMLLGKRTKCEIWSRVMGYHRPVSYFNIGKKSEFEERSKKGGYFKEPKEK